MFCGDSLEDPAAFVAMKAIHWIPAKDIYVVCSCYFVPELFESNRRLRQAFRPQAGRAFSTSRNATMFPVCRFGRCADEAARGIREANRVGHLVDHECGEHLCNTHRDIPALFNDGRKIHTLWLQCLTKTNEM